MGLFKAAAKSAATGINNAMYNSAVDQASDRAYKNVGKQLKHAKKTGKFINAKAAYQKEVKRQLQKAEDRKVVRQKFIDNI